ncbi:MAG: AAA family ATPase [Deltaproteobacteria bacterium]|nr:AAA family ATPase [Deltaproteobacteria bacterium]
MVEIRVVGQLAVLRDGKPMALPASKKTRALLGYLAVTRVAQPRERLCSLLWDGPDDPRAALRWSLTKLRPLVDVVADREAVALGEASIDLAIVREASPRSATGALQAAAAHLRGDLLEGLDLADCFRWDEWLRGERERVRRHGTALLAELAARGGRAEEQLGFARQWVALDPLSEPAHAAVIGALVELGRKTEARAQLDSCTRLLQRELGRGPSRDLERMRIAIGAATVAAPEPVPATVAIARTPLVGRAAELAALSRWLEGNGARAVMLLGEPGIGKTRLLDEVAARAPRVVRGRGVEAELVRPFGAWLDALEMTLPTDGDRATLFEAVRARVGDAVVVLDDVQWLDEASTALTHYLARAGVRIACAARPGELADHPAALRLVRGMTREQLLEQIGLSPLSAVETAALAEAYAPGVAADRVYAESGGHPLFAVEIARALARGETRWDSLDALIGDRLDLVAGIARDLVPWAAALGRAFTADTLAAITGISLTDLARAIGELEQRALLRGTDDAWDFAHDLIRGAAYARISQAHKRLLHLQIARVLAALPDPDGEHAVEVAHHAGLGGDSALCADACVTAGRRCLRLFAPEEAAVHARRGLTHVVRLSGEARIRLQIELLSVAHLGDLDGRHIAELTRALERAVLDAQAAGCHAEAARGYNVLSHLHFRSNDFDSAREDSIHAAERARDADPTARAQALAFSAQCLALLERDIPEVERLAAEAAALLRDTRAEVVELPFALALVHHYEGDDAAALTLLARAIALAEQRGVHWQVAQLRARAALIELGRGGWQAAREHGAVLTSLVGKMGEGGDGALGDVVEAIVRLALDGDASALATAFTQLQASDAPVLLAPAAGVAADLLAAGGAQADAAAYAKLALQAAERASRPSELARARARCAGLASGPHGR